MKNQERSDTQKATHTPGPWEYKGEIMNFTDDMLKTLKEMEINPFMQSNFLYDNRFALIARLEAAEAIVEKVRWDTETRQCIKDCVEAWCKAAGK